MSSQSAQDQCSNASEERSKTPENNNNNNNNNSHNSNSKDVCREFIRGFCFRGSGCKFRHPPPNEMAELGHRGPQFCHDYQNRYCHRPSCRYTHATKDEEAEYHRTGVLPLRVLRLQFGDPEIPVCRDFLSGKCSRGKDCKFRHLSEREVEQEKRNLEFYSKQTESMPNMGPAPLFGNGGPYPPNRNPAAMGLMGPGGRFPGESGGGNDLKRRRMGDGFMGGGGGMPGEMFFGGPDGGPEQNGATAAAIYRTKQLEDENGALLRKIDDLKRQIQQLNDTNDELLEQNARLRSQLQKALATSQPLPVPAPLPLSGSAQPGLNNGANMFSMVAAAAAAQHQQQHQQQQAQFHSFKRENEGYDFR